MAKTVRKRPKTDGIKLDEWALPEDVVVRVQRAIVRVFQECASDLEQSLEKGEKLTLSMAAEVAMDADRPIFMGNLSKEDWAKFQALGYEAMDKMAQEWLKPYF